MENYISKDAIWQNITQLKKIDVYNADNEIINTFAIPMGFDLFKYVSERYTYPKYKLCSEPNLDNKYDLKIDVIEKYDGKEKMIKFYIKSNIQKN